VAPDGCAIQMMLDPNLSTLIITQQQHQRYSYISLAQIDRPVNSDNPAGNIHSLRHSLTSFNFYIR